MKYSGKKLLYSMIILKMFGSMKLIAIRYGGHEGWANNLAMYPLAMQRSVLIP
jgi:hypothetical protein